MSDKPKVDPERYPWIAYFLEPTDTNWRRVVQSRTRKHASLDEACHRFTTELSGLLTETRREAQYWALIWASEELRGEVEQAAHFSGYFLEQGERIRNGEASPAGDVPRTLEVSKPEESSSQNGSK